MRYYQIKKDIKNAEKRKYVAGKIQKLKAAIEDRVPKKELDQNLLIATWNIRDFDSNKFGHGPRLKESFFYIAQMISAFDLVAVQEITKDLWALKKLIYILGSNWDFITTDVTDGRSGNHERMTFIYDTRRVEFKNIAGEIVLPSNRRIQGDIQFARTPYLVSFQSGWSKFSLCTVHIYYGADSGDKLARRKSEIEGIAKFLKKRADSDKETLIVLGDFNIVHPDHATMDALLDNGFELPEQIREKPVGTNTFKTKYYDQIAVRSKSKYFELGTGEKSAGSFDYFDFVFSEDDFEHYKENVIASKKKQKRNKENELARKKRAANPNLEDIQKLEESIREMEAEMNNDVEMKEYYFRKWKTFQMSDHLPLWTEIKVEHSDTYLNLIKE